ncbi:tetratricopeptide repeat protein [Actinoplanes palleronii]|nr:tetratricopeptide repeat protein [Actinoplanes palleronii]
MVILDRGARRWARRMRLLARATVVLLVAVGLISLLALLLDEHRRDGLLQFRQAGLALLQVGGILLLLFLAIGLITWLSQPMGMAFENATGDPELSGATLAQSIAGELQRIEAVHAAEAQSRRRRAAAPSVSLQPAVLSRRETMASSVLAPLAPSGRADAVAAIGTIDVAGASLPLGSMLAAVKQLWPLPRSGVMIAGRLRREGESLALTVHVRRGRKAMPHEFTVTAQSGDTWRSYNDLVTASAIRIAYGLTPDDRGISNAGFGHLTRALEFYHDFQRIGDRQALESAVGEAHAIPAGDDRQPDVRGLIYNLGICCLQVRDLEGSERLLLRARRADPSDAVIGNAVGMLYFEQRRFTEAKEILLVTTRLNPSHLWDRLSNGECRYASWNQLGNTYVELADYVRAIEAYQEAVKRPRDWAVPHSGLGNAYLQQHRWDDAEREYDRALAIDETSAYARCGLGNLEARRSRFQKAFDHYNEALRHDVLFASAWNGLGEVHAALGRYKEAVAAHEQALELRPDDLYSLSSLGDTYRKQRDLDRALEVLERARGIDDSAAYVWRNLGELHLARNDPAEAAHAFAEAVRRDPRDAVAWDGRARAARILDNSGEEQDSLLQAARENPMEPWGWNQLGDAYRRGGLHQESLRAHEMALSRDPDNSYALDGMGKALLALGDFDQARRMHEAAQRADPANAFAAHGVADVLMARGDYRGSIAANERALRIDEQAAYARNSIGDAYERLREYPEAEGQFRATLEKSGQDGAATAYAYDGLARVALAQGRHASALDAAQQAYDLRPRLAFPLVTIGNIHLAQGTYDEAVEAFRQALARNPAKMAAWDGLGRAYVWQGDFATASETYQKAVAACGDDGRLSLGAADVAVRSAVARSEGGSLDNALKDYETAIAMNPALSTVAHVRLAVLAAHRGDPATARQHAGAALHDFPCCWQRRPLPDADLRELRALALLITGDRKSAAAARDKARATLPIGARFDSVRVGVYDLLTEDQVSGFTEFAAEIPRGPELLGNRPPDGG